jgi:DNA-binding transcriptional LysR family regulator
MAGEWQWDDVRIFLAVSREGTFSGAARALGVDHVTVARRIASLEEHLGAKLLSRTPDGLRPRPPARPSSSSARAWRPPRWASSG